MLTVLLTYTAPPLLILAGWYRWWQQRANFRTDWLVSGSALGLATASALLATGAIAYAQLIHGFAYYQPALMRIYGIGLLLSALGLLISIGGLWIKSPPRWLAPLACLSTLVFWFLMAGME